MVDNTPSMGSGYYSPAELRQLLNGFRAVLTEALEEREPETDTFFMETAVPGMAAEGQTTESLVQASAAFGVMLSMRLVAEVPADQQDEARAWLARFFGEYVQRVLRAARQAEGAA